MTMAPSLAVAERLGRGGVVKIDGLREPDHAAAAAAAGADLIGFIFAPGRRWVTAEHAAQCIARARGAANHRSQLFVVGVFVDALSSEIAEIAEVAGLDLIQLHGNEPPDFAAALPLPAIKALKPPPGAMAAEVVAEASEFLAADISPLAVLIDGFHPTSAGGTGVQADWMLAARVAEQVPMLLAGGLTPGTVAEAVKTVRPLGVDVSSGVERDGVKDPGLIEAFVRSAKGAFAEVSPGLTTPG